MLIQLPSGMKMKCIIFFDDILFEIKTIRMNHACDYLKQDIPTRISKKLIGFPKEYNY